MIGNMIHLLNNVLSGPGVYEVVFEISLIVRLNYFWGAMKPQDLLFKSQDGVPSSGVRHRVRLQPSSDCFHHDKHVTLALAGLQECDVMNRKGLPIFIF